MKKKLTNLYALAMLLMPIALWVLLFTYFKGRFSGPVMIIMIGMTLLAWLSAGLARENSRDKSKPKLSKTVIYKGGSSMYLMNDKEVIVIE